jgi:hypothetical protein
MEFINCMYVRDKLHCHLKSNSNAKNAEWYLALNKSFGSMLTRNMLEQHNPNLLLSVVEKLIINLDGTTNNLVVAYSVETKVIE